jgi:hypothetical protein
MPYSCVKSLSKGKPKVRHGSEIVLKKRGIAGMLDRLYPEVQLTKRFMVC